MAVTRKYDLWGDEIPGREAVERKPYKVTKDSVVIGGAYLAYLVITGLYDIFHNPKGEGLLFPILFWLVFVGIFAGLFMIRLKRYRSGKVIQPKSPWELLRDKLDSYDNRLREGKR